MSDINALAREVQDAWDKAFSRPSDSALDYRQAVIAVEIVLRAVEAEQADAALRISGGWTRAGLAGQRKRGAPAARDGGIEDLADQVLMFVQHADDEHTRRHVKALLARVLQLGRSIGYDERVDDERERKEDQRGVADAPVSREFRQQVSETMDRNDELLRRLAEAAGDALVKRDAEVRLREQPARDSCKVCGDIDQPEYRHHTTDHDHESDGCTCCQVRSRGLWPDAEHECPHCGHYARSHTGDPG